MAARQPRLVLMLAAVAGLGVLAAPAAGKAPVRAASAAKDWTRTVTATPEGGFRMGNPAAKLKVVEYGSLTCPHCAHFAREGAPPLIEKYVKTGAASYEFRNFVLNGVDVAATLLARCAGPRGFFGMTETLYATQPVWLGKITGLPRAEKATLNSLSEGARLVRVAEIGGLLDVAASHGVTAVQASTCLRDDAARGKLGTMAEAAEALGVSGTPTFFVNGRMIDGRAWAEVDAALAQAGS